MSKDWWFGEIPASHTLSMQQLVALVWAAKTGLVGEA